VPCIFCIAIFATVAGAIGAAVLDDLEAKISEQATTPVERTAESGSMTKLEFEYPLPDGAKTSEGKTSVPVALTVYKDTKRVRIQVLTHSIDRSMSQLVQQRIAEVAGLQIQSYSSEESEHHVHDAMEHGHAHEEQQAQQNRQQFGTPNS
jgi:hypothetical protein